MHRHQVEYIEYPDRAAMSAALADVRSGEDVVHVDVIDLGKTLRVTRLVDEDGEAADAGAPPAEEDVTVQAETLSDGSEEGGGTPAPADPTDPAENGSDGQDLIGDPEPEPDIVAIVHNSSLAELEALVEAGTYTAAQVLEAEIGEGGRQRQNVQYAFRAAE